MKAVVYLAVVALSGWLLVVPAGARIKQVTADPDIIGSGAEYHGTLQMKAGECISVGIVDIGGFVEVRNESRFNQGVFPNHNWRGCISGLVTVPLISQMQLSLDAYTGLMHESSHATMGIAESTSDPYALIYDNSYRKSLLNGVPVGVQFEMFDQVNRVVLKGWGTWYFLSKNTPELPGLETAQSGGLAFSAAYRYLLGKQVSCFAALHNRYIFRGPSTRIAEVYRSGETGPVLEAANYPVMNRANTFSVTGGISVPLFQARRRMDCYVRYLYGHVYGYVDSREKRSQAAAGVVVYGW